MDSNKGQMLWRLALYISQDDKQTGLTYHKAAFKLMGLYFWGANTWWQTIYAYVPMLVLGINGTLILIYAILVGKSEGFIEFVKGSVLVFTFYFGVVKLMIFHYHAQDFQRAFDFFEAQPRQGGVDTSKAFRRLLKVYAGVLTTTGTVWGLWSTAVKGTAYEVYLPFETPSPKLLFKLLGDLQKLLCDIYCIIGHSAVDTTMSMMVCYLEYQGSRLDACLSRLGKNTKRDLKIIRQAVDIHVVMLTSVKHIKATYQAVFLAQAIYTVVHACVTTFSAMKVNDLEVIVTQLIPMICSAYLQLFVHCTSGERVKSIMDHAARTIYSNHWYQADLRARKHLVIMKIVASKAVTVNSYGISTASLETYLQSVKESFSYFIALKTITSNDE